MLERDNIAEWLWTMRNHGGPKLVTGRRGIGKSTQLTIFAGMLIAQGVPRKKVVFLDGGSILARRLSSSGRTIDFIVEQCRGLEDAYLLIREGSAFPDLATTLGALAASPRYNVFATISSRSIFTEGLGDYLEGNFAHYECTPSVHSYDPVDIQRIWNEALLYDVCTPIRQPFNAQILNSLACHLSDRTGDPLSLRNISAAISPPFHQISPHTIDNYLTALCDAYLIEKCLRYDLAEECILKNQFRCYFPCPAMRTTLFGPAPTDETRRKRLNDAWLKLRQESDEVFFPSSAPKNVDFVTRKGTNIKLWHVGDEEISEVSRNSFIAG